METCNNFLKKSLRLNQIEDDGLIKCAGRWMKEININIPSNVDDDVLKDDGWLIHDVDKFWYNPNCRIETAYSIIYKAWMPDHGLCVYKRIMKKDCASVKEHMYLQTFLPYTIPYIVKTYDGLVYPFKGFDVDIHYRNICKERITKHHFDTYSICASLIVHHKYILNTIHFIAAFLHRLYKIDILWKDAKLSNVLYQSGQYKVVDLGSLTPFEINGVYRHNTFNNGRVNPIFHKFEYFNTYVVGIILLEMICSRVDIQFLTNNLDTTLGIINKHRSHNTICDTLVTLLFFCFGDDLQLLKRHTTGVTAMAWHDLFHHMTIFKYKIKQ